MSTDYSSLVAKVWNYAHVLRDQGISYGDYVEQITFLLFLKMDQERNDLLNEASISRPSGAGAKWHRFREMILRCSTEGRSKDWRRRGASSARYFARRRTSSPTLQS